MKIRTMLGLALIGTAVYAHKQRGGEMTLDSFKQSFRDLIGAIQNKAEKVETKARAKAKDLAGTVEAKAKDFGDKVADKAQDVANAAGGYGTDSGYGSYTNRR